MILDFLPPYSPDYNPIEYSFAVLKRHLKTNDYLSQINAGDEEGFANAIIAAAAAAVTPQIAANQYHHCGFRIQ
jgi:hypothetical protein